MKIGDLIRFKNEPQTIGVITGEVIHDEWYPAPGDTFEVLWCGSQEVEDANSCDLEVVSDASVMC